MENPSLDVRLFRYALAAAEHGSFRRAAAALDVQQSSVSRGVRNLEHRVGAELFERSNSGIRPTRAGERFLGEAVLGFDHLRRAMQRASAVQRGEHGELVVCASVPLELLRDLLEPFRVDNASVAVEFVESTSNAAWALVQQRKVDVAFVAKTRADGTLRTSHLRDERIIAVFPNSSPLADASELSLDDLHLERFLLSTNGMGPDLEEYLVTSLAEQGFEVSIRPQRIGEDGIMALAAMGFGATMVIGHPGGGIPDGLAFVPLTGNNVLPVHVVWIDSNPNPALQVLLSVVQQPD